MSISDRDRKILMLLVPLALVIAYWFLMLAPKREEATAFEAKLTQAQTERDTAESRASSLSAAKSNFADDYAAVIYLGKSIPSTVDMPSLLVQLDRAARGTGINFTSVQTGERVAATEPGAATPPSGGAAPAASAPGAAGQNAQGAVDQSNSAGATGTGSQPAGAAPAEGAAPGLDSLSLDFQFSGSFFDLADFFHRMKRFVRVANEDIIVRGRLMTINSFSFDSKDTFPQLKATVHATVYLAPKAQGVAAGASPAGPDGGTPATTPAGSQTASSGSSSPTPAATVSAR